MVAVTQEGSEHRRTAGGELWYRAMAHFPRFWWGVCVCDLLRRCSQSSALGTWAELAKTSQHFTTYYPAVPVCCPRRGSGRWRICRRAERHYCVVGVHGSAFPFFHLDN